MSALYTLGINAAYHDSAACLVRDGQVLACAEEERFTHRKHGKRPAIVAFVDGCTAAAIGTIAGAVVVLGRRSIVDLPTIAILAVTVVLLWKVKKLNEPMIVALAAIVGLIVYPILKA